MKNKDKVSLVLGIVAGVVVAVVLILVFSAINRTPDKRDNPPLGAPGNQLIEQYDPYVLYNGGINTALGITNSGILTQSGATNLTGSFSVGSSGTDIEGVYTGFCNVYAPANTISATSSQALTCHAGESNALSALDGITVGNVCFLQTPTSTPGTGLGVVLTGVSASNTPGYLDARGTNLQQSTFTWSAAASSSWAYTCYEI